jgi:hypothetical protein
MIAPTVSKQAPLKMRVFIVGDFLRGAAPQGKTIRAPEVLPDSG